tara:strand:- start:276 stop:1403 length:1128 start_codon:yes stop_codon:yes gene_type:complete
VKILQITPSLSNAGAERFVVDISNQLSKLGHDITIISLVGEFNSFHLSKEINKKIKLIFLNKKMKGFSFKVFNLLNNFLKKNNFDIIHTHIRSLNYISLPNLINSKNKIVHTIHSDASKESRSKLVRLYRKQLFKNKFVYPVCISEVSLDSFKKIYNLKSKMIKNGSRKISRSQKYIFAKKNLKKFKINDETKIYVNIARISKPKNQQLLINIFKTLRKESINAILLIIGGAKTEKNKKVYEQMKKDSPSNVFFLGELDNATDYLFLSDFFCLSSLWEGMPISLIESFSAGCIPICTPAGGIKNMIFNNINGFISKDFTYDSYINKIRKSLILDKANVKQMKINSLTSFKKIYSIKNCALNYEKYFDEILNNTKN